MNHSTISTFQVTKAREFIFLIFQQYFFILKSTHSTRSSLKTLRKNHHRYASSLRSVLYCKWSHLRNVSSSLFDRKRRQERGVRNSSITAEVDASKVVACTQFSHINLRLRIGNDPIKSVLTSKSNLDSTLEGNARRVNRESADDVAISGGGEKRTSTVAVRHVVLPTCSYAARTPTWVSVEFIALLICELEWRARLTTDDDGFTRDARRTMRIRWYVRLESAGQPLPSFWSKSHAIKLSGKSPVEDRSRWRVKTSRRIEYRRLSFRFIDSIGVINYSE